MKITFPDKAAALKRADEIHAALKLSDPLYKASCDLYDEFNGAKGGTARWAIPYQVKDKNGVPIDTLWHVTVAARVGKMLTAQEWKTATPTVSAQ